VSALNSVVSYLDRGLLRSRHRDRIDSRCAATWRGRVWRCRPRSLDNAPNTSFNSRTCRLPVDCRTPNSRATRRKLRSSQKRAAPRRKRLLEVRTGGAPRPWSNSIAAPALRTRSLVGVWVAQRRQCGRQFGRLPGHSKRHRRKIQCKQNGYPRAKPRRLPLWKRGAHRNRRRGSATK
jgi:hypothetical protein